MSWHVADAAATRFLCSWSFVHGGVSHYLPSLLSSISTSIQSTTKGTWWRCVLISPLEEATLLLSWFPAGVEHAALVWTVLLHHAHHRRLITVTHYLSPISSWTPFLPSASCGGVPEPHRGPRRPGGLQCLRRRPSTLQCPLLTWLIRPQKEVAAPGVALVELATLVGTVLAHSQEECILTTVTHNDITAGVYTTASTSTWWKSWLLGP